MDIRCAVALLEAGDWESAHTIVQDDKTSLGAWAHGIVHMLEGDMANAGYWYRRAGKPAGSPDRIDDEWKVIAAAAVDAAG